VSHEQTACTLLHDFTKSAKNLINFTLVYKTATEGQPNSSTH